MIGTVIDTINTVETMKIIERAIIRWFLLQCFNCFQYDNWLRDSTIDLSSEDVGVLTSALNDGFDLLLVLSSTEKNSTIVVEK